MGRNVYEVLEEQHFAHAGRLECSQLLQSWTHPRRVKTEYVLRWNVLHVVRRVGTSIPFIAANLKRTSHTCLNAHLIYPSPICVAVTAMTQDCQSRDQRVERRVAEEQDHQYLGHVWLGFSFARVVERVWLLTCGFADNSQSLMLWLCLLLRRQGEKSDCFVHNVEVENVALVAPLPRRIAKRCQRHHIIPTVWTPFTIDFCTMAQVDTAQNLNQNCGKRTRAMNQSFAYHAKNPACERAKTWPF